ncbi:MAG: ATP synthase F1 subunit delta [Flavobacteriaceae bacterium]|jgi:F-type H+-transporting ATPase subunit delta|nr:ATP synthase F1 subunit delta [Flavobacteriaceae bacterium]MDG2314685.1 ATP synthase F1 subunit delta [Flavobacteriaceae bacterium]
MKGSRAALRYAKAGLSFAVDKQVAAEVNQDMQSIAATLAQSTDLKELLASPVLKNVQKKTTVKAVFSSLHPVSSDILELLVTNNRINLLGIVAQQYVKLYDQHEGREVAYVTTAIPLDQALTKQVLAKIATLTDKKVTLENKVDETILGGFVLRIADVQYNASVAHKLQTLKQTFITNTNVSTL